MTIPKRSVTLKSSRLEGGSPAYTSGSIGYAARIVTRSKLSAGYRGFCHNALGETAEFFTPTGRV